MRSNARAHSWKVKVCFAMGKHASQCIEQMEANLSYNLLVTSHFLWKLLQRTICHRRYSDWACDDFRYWYSRSHVSVAHLVFRSISAALQLANSVFFWFSFKFRAWHVVFVGENRKRWKRTVRQSHIPLTSIEHMLYSGPPIFSGNGHGSQKGRKSMFSVVF